MASGETLLPCPFCGSVRVECAGEDSPFWKLCRAHCNDCGATSGTYFNTRAEAIARWNRRAAHQERDADASCVWTCDEDGNWDTACGGMFILLADTPKQNGMNFCCYCGRTLTEADGRAPDTQTEGEGDGTA